MNAQYGNLADEAGFFLFGFNEEWIYGHSSPHVMSLVIDQDLKQNNPALVEDPLNLAKIHKMQPQVQQAPVVEVQPTPVVEVQPTPVVLANEMNFISSLFVASLKYGPSPYTHRTVNLPKKQVKLRLGILPKESFHQKTTIIGVRIDYHYPLPPYGG